MLRWGLSQIWEVLKNEGKPNKMDMAAGMDSRG